MTRKTKTKILVAAAAASALTLTGCAAVSTPPDMVALQYQGGPTQAKTLKECVAVSTNKREFSWGDEFYQYPASQRYYEAKGDGNGADGPAITFVTKDGIEMRVDSIAYFDLNTTCETLQKFHEQIGSREHAYFDDPETVPAGWAHVLDIYIGGPLNTAVDRAGQDYTYSALYNDNATKTKWEQQVLELLPGLVDRQTDGSEQFFSNFSITLQKPEPPKAIVDALVAQQAAVQKARAAEAEAQAQKAATDAQVIVEQAEAKKAAPWVAILGKDGYLKKLSIEAGLNPLQPTYSYPAAPTK